MIAAYGLFGFGYVITATFLVAIVRQSPAIRPLEPWIWMLFGLAAVPSVPLWHSLGDRIGLARAYAVACIVEAIGVAASVEWVTVFGICVSAVLLGGTFTGQTALGLMSERPCAGGPSSASGDQPDDGELQHRPDGRPVRRRFSRRADGRPAIGVPPRRGSACARRRARGMVVRKPGAALILCLTFPQPPAPASPA
jgi:hypothetical protein